MTWQPIIVEAGERDRIVGVLHEIVGALDAFHMEARSSSASDFLDLAVLRHYLDLDDTVPDPDDAVSENVARAIERFTPESGLSLFGGSCELGWTVAHLADRDTADAICTSIDQVIATAVGRGSWSGDYDLIAGLVGFGVYALERGNHDLAIAVLTRLEELAVVRGGGVAWYTHASSLGPWERERSPDGYWNLGVAHGIGGVIGFLAALVRSGIEADRAAKLLRAALRYALSIAPEATTGRFAAWEHAARANARGPDEAPRGRLAWCYGDLGMSFVLRAGGLAVGDDQATQIADALARDCTERDTDSQFLLDAGFCHGRAGVAHLMQSLALSTGEPSYARCARAIIAELLEKRDDRRIAGFPTFVPFASAKADASLTTGVVGVGLVLHAAISHCEPAWIRRFLMHQ